MNEHNENEFVSLHATPHKWSEITYLGFGYHHDEGIGPMPVTKI